MEPLVHTVPAGLQRVRADKVLATAFPEFSRVAIRRAFDAGLVTMNGVVIETSKDAASGDVLSLTMPEVKVAQLRAVDIKLDVLFEDKQLLVINKPSGMVVHPGAATGEDTLVHALLAHCKGSLSGIGGVERPGIVHRLDRETSGLIIVAKTDKAHRALAEQFAERTIQKEYLALVVGATSLLSGSIKSGIGRDPKHRHRMAAFEAEKGGGRPSRTDWVVEQQFGKLASLLRCILHTGRTHQIRVHLKSTGNVILGDSVYGWKPDERLGFTPKRVMLHAEHVVFHHPVSGKEIDLRAPLPKDFKAALKALRQASKDSAAKPQRKL
jgi:23S rRNA pseudouridine1911/1915/1917 synthase